MLNMLNYVGFLITKLISCSQMIPLLQIQSFCILKHFFPSLHDKLKEQLRSPQQWSFTFQTSLNSIKIMFSKQHVRAASFLLDLNKRDVREAHFWALDPIVACNYL